MSAKKPTSGADLGATLEALKRCTLKAMHSKDGRTAAGAVREARNSLQHAGHDAAAALQMAKAAASVGEAVQVHLAMAGQYRAPDLVAESVAVAVVGAPC